MNPVAFLALWRDDNAAARAHVATLGAGRIGLAAELPAQFTPPDPRAIYTYWIRQFDCPVLVVTNEDELLKAIGAL